MAEAVGTVETLDLPSIVTEVEKAIAVADDVVDVVQKFQNFLPPSIETAVTDLQTILTALQSVVSKV